MHEQDVIIKLDALTWFSVLAAVQLASRHPSWNGPSRLVAINGAKAIQEKLEKIVPEHSVIMQMGWDSSNDVDIRHTN